MKRGYKGKMLLLGFVLLMTPVVMTAQDEKDFIRKGNRLYKKGEFSGSESMYRRAQNQEKSTADAGFNLGDALYKQGRFSEAATEFDRASEGYEDLARKAEVFYNLGNALLKDQKYKESIEAYINSLRLEPDNPAAKYNLAYAQEELKKQEEQQKQQHQQQDQKQPEPQQGTMSREDAKRLLEALSAAEKKTQEKVQKEKARGAKTRVIKNW